MLKALLKRLKERYMPQSFASYRADIYESIALLMQYATCLMEDSHPI